MKSCAFSIVIAWVVGGAMCAQAAAEELGLARQYDPWGRFQPGAWTRVEVKTEAFGDDGTLESVTETRTTLKDVGDESVTLKVDVGVKIGSKQIETDPQTITQGFHGELSTSEPKVTDLGTTQVVIENRQIPCQVWELEFPRPVGRKITKIFFSDTVEPYILRQETALYGEDADTPTSETTREVVALAAPCRLFRNFRAASREKSVHKDASGTTTTWMWTSALVPGGVICYTSQQVDNEGRLVCRRELKMLDYGFQEPSRRSGWFSRWRRIRVRGTGD